MKIKSAIYVSLLILALSGTTFAKTGTISTTKAGTISTTKTGTISTTATGPNRSGTISTTRFGTISTTRIDALAGSDRLSLIQLLIAALRVW